MVETGQRVEVEDVGLALTIPASWVVDDPASHPFDLAVKDLARLGECWLVVEAASLYAGETLADKAPAYAAELRRIFESETVPEWITLTLPSGSAVRLDTGSRWHDSFTDLWLRGEDLPALTCQGLDPGDQWLSIAESLELMTVVEPTPMPAPPTAVPTAVASTPRPGPATVIEQTHEPVKVKVTQRGSRPRRLLRYDWTEGQKESLGVDIRMNSESSLGVESSGRVEVPTLRMTVTIEVHEVFANGDYLVEQQLTELGVPIGEEGDMAMAREIEAVLASMIRSADTSPRQRPRCSAAVGDALSIGHGTGEPKTALTRASMPWLRSSSRCRSSASASTRYGGYARISKRTWASR